MSAQNQSSKFSVKGQVVDSLTQESMPYATCSVVLEKDPQKVVSRFASDIEGNFTGEIKTPGSYKLIVTSVGKKPVTRSFSVDVQNNQI